MTAPPLCASLISKWRSSHSPWRFEQSWGQEILEPSSDPSFNLESSLSSFLLYQSTGNACLRSGATCEIDTFSSKSAAWAFAHCIDLSRCLSIKRWIFFHKILSSTTEKEEQDRIRDQVAKSCTDTAQSRIFTLKHKNSKDKQWQLCRQPNVTG